MSNAPRIGQLVRRHAEPLSFSDQDTLLHQLWDKTLKVEIVVARHKLFPAGFDAQVDLDVAGTIHARRRSWRHLFFGPSQPTAQDEVIDRYNIVLIARSRRESEVLAAWVDHFPAFRDIDEHVYWVRALSSPSSIPIDHHSFHLARFPRLSFLAFAEDLISAAS